MKPKQPSAAPAADPFQDATGVPAGDANAAHVPVPPGGGSWQWNGTEWTKPDAPAAEENPSPVEE